MKKIYIMFILVILILFSSCTMPAQNKIKLPDANSIIEYKTNEIYENMSDFERVCQLFIIRYPQDNGLEFLKEYPVGGVCLFAVDFEGKTQKTASENISEMQSHMKTPLIVSVDEEGGTVTRISRFPEMRGSKFKSPQELYKDGGFEGIANDTAEKSKYLKSLGINMNFAPVADVVTDEKGVLYKRSFGKGAEETSVYVETTVAGMKKERIGSSLKHFPGYGNSRGDTHEGLDINNKSISELENTDIKPFEAGISAGADSIMVTHTVVNAFDDKNPASLSPAVYSYARNDLGFNGVLLTDGLDMGAVIDFCDGIDPSLTAILAGADMALTPKDAKAGINAVTEALNDGILSHENLKESVIRILKMKFKLGIL